MALELELKLGLTPEQAARFGSIPMLEAFTKTSSELLLNMYYDTPDEQLKAHKMAVRIRKLGDQWIQTLKTAGVEDSSGVSQRGEWEWPIDGPSLQPDLLLEHVPNAVDLSELYPQFSTHFKRTTWQVWVDGHEIELACDQGEIRSGNRVAPIAELELELKNSNEIAALHTLALDIAKVVPVWIGRRSKAQRGQELKFERSPLPVLPDMRLVSGTATELVKLCTQLLSSWTQCYELLIVARDAELINTLISAMERLMSALRMLDKEVECHDLLIGYQSLFLSLLPLMDIAYFSGSDPRWYRQRQDEAKQHITQLLDQLTPGQLALETGQYLQEMNR